jgi:F0F1-type ATP synthase membrane subunit a
MKLFASKFYQTLILNLATIAAIVAGLYQFAVRSYKENNGPEKTRKVMQTVLQFVDNIVEQGKVYFAEPAPAVVPPVKVAQRRTKRS